MKRIMWKHVVKLADNCGLIAEKVGSKYHLVNNNTGTTIITDTVREAYREAWDESLLVSAKKMEAQVRAKLIQ